MAVTMNVADRTMGLSLRVLNLFAGSELVERAGLRKPAARLVERATRDGIKAAGTASRTFTAATRLGRPARLRATSSSGLFDLTPDDDQQMLRDTFKEFGAGELRPRAQAADAACEAPAELIDQAAELGLTMLGVPEDLGGAVSERSAMTTVLVAEALANGDAGLATAILAPAGVAAALALWGDADQQSTYLPPFVGDDVPGAALALMETRALFNPFSLQTIARPKDGGYVLSGAKALVPGAAKAELFLVGAQLEGKGAALFIVESSAAGVFTEPEPAMGLRAAATATLTLDEVGLPGMALVGGGDPAVYAECVHRARLAWCAVAVGTAQAVLDHVIPYVNERKAFGEPISHRQAVAFAVSDIAIELEGMRLALWRAASLADREKPFAKEAAVARHLCATKGAVIGSQGVQLLGGHGYVKEYPVERWFRDLRATGVMEGALLV
ncbi:MAG: acyl-CoA dehydrogenase family protein [Solirubrobacteraceae bacterium]